MLGMSEGRRMLGVLWGTNAPVQLSRRVRVILSHSPRPLRGSSSHLHGAVLCSKAFEAPALAQGAVP